MFDDVNGGWGLAVRQSHEVYGLIRDGSGESRVGGGDVRSSGDIPCPDLILGDTG